MSRLQVTRRRALAAGALAATAGLTGISLSTGRDPDPVDGSWRQGRGDAANTGVAAGAGPDGPASARWTVRKHLVGGKPPAVADGRLYVGYDDDEPTFAAFDAATGGAIWRTTFEASVGFPDSAAAVAADVVLAPFAALLAGLDPSSGEVRWRRRLGEQLTAPVLADGTAYAAVGRTGRVVALDPGSGETVWQRRVGDWLPAGVAVAGGRLFAVTSAETTGTLVALDAATGERRWKRSLETAPASRPSVAAGSVYIATDGGLHASTVDGAHRFTFPYTSQEEAAIRYSRGGSSPAVADGTVYVGAPDGRVYAVDAATGEETWSFWTWNAVSGDPVVAGDTVYVASDDTFVYALDAAAGTRRWEFDTAGPADGAGGAVVDGLLFVATEGDGLYALEGP